MQQDISPGIEAAADSDREVRQLVDRRYELLRPLGRGAVAHVYLAYDHVLNREVAVKMLTAEAASDPAFVERFRREARAIASLNHPNIVTVYDWGTTGGTDYMVMEYVAGGSLGDSLSHVARLSEEEALRIAEGVAAALAAAHARHIVHRDIKPDNILLTPDRHVKVADFGIAREQGVSALTQTNAVFGTVSYISPEQARGDIVDGRSDLYSLGVVLYRMVTGQLPFRGRSMVDVAIQHVQEAPRQPREIRPELSRQTDAIIMKALQKRPEDRYAGADEMLRALRGASQSATRQVAERVPRPPERAATIRTDALLRTAKAEGTPHAASANRESSRLPLLALPIALLALVAGLLFAAHSWSSSRHAAISPPTPAHSTHRSSSGTTKHQAASPTSVTSASTRNNQGQPTSRRGTANGPTSGRGATSAPSGAGAGSVAAPSGADGAQSAPPQSTSSAASSGTAASGATGNNTASSGTTSGTATNASTPAGAVIAFYTAVGEHRFDDAASLWTPALRQQFAPSYYINTRFGDTRSIWVVPTVRSNDTAAGTALVDVRVTETKASTGQQLELVGTWQLVEQNGRWLLNWPTFPNGGTPAQSPGETAVQPTSGTAAQSVGEPPAPPKGKEKHSIKVDEKAQGHHGNGE